MSNVVPIRPVSYENSFIQWAIREGLSVEDLEALRIRPVKQEVIAKLFNGFPPPGNLTGGVLIPYPGTHVARLIIHGDDNAHWVSADVEFPK